jgi:transcriptional regulator with XRE-family HTH domain
VTEDEVKAPSEAAAEELRRVRMRKGWNQQQLADRLHELGAPIDRATISKIETGDRRVTLDETFWFAYALGVSPAALVLPRPARSMVAVTPTTSVTALETLYWLRGVYSLAEGEWDEAEERFFAEETLDEEVLAYRRLPTVSSIRVLAERAVTQAARGHGSELRRALEFLQEDVTHALRTLERDKRGEFAWHPSEHHQRTSGAKEGGEGR